MAKAKYGREPLKMFSEIADDLGVDFMELVRLMKKHQPCPKPKLSHGSSISTNKRTYYSPKEVQLWWKSL